MAVRVVEDAPEQVSTDDFQVLEQKVYRTIELYKAAREARSVAERDIQRLREQLEEREEEVETLRRQMVQLKREREEIRGRVEKMLQHIETIAEQSAAS
jgi:predicted RNase H-like nuclease (RuvC/YqgF family)